MALHDRDFGRARALAGEALRLDPGHEGARRLRDDVERVWATAVTSIEAWPEAASRWGGGAARALVLHPRWPLSLAASYEYLRRYGTDNHRVGLEATWRATPAFSLLAGVRGGAVHAVPAFTANLRADWQLAPPFGAGLFYELDDMRGPGQENQVGVEARWQVVGRLGLEAAGGVGRLAACGASELSWMGRGRVTASVARVQAFLQYAYGSELDRMAASGEETCPAAGQPALFRQQSQDVGGGAWIDLSARTALRASYDYVKFSEGNQLHLVSVALREAF